MVTIEEWPGLCEGLTSCKRVGLAEGAVFGKGLAMADADMAIKAHPRPNAAHCPVRAPRTPSWGWRVQPQIETEMDVRIRESSR